MAQAASNDGEFAEKLEALRPALMKHAFWLCRSRSVAEGIVQEAMLRAWRSRAQLRDAGALKGWLITICRNEHARTFERKRVPTVCLDDLPADAQPLVDDGDAVEVAEIRRAILELDEMYRVPLIMQVVDGRSTAEIAEHLGIKLQTILTRLFRARRLLRQRLGPIVAGSRTDKSTLRASRMRRSNARINRR